MYGVIGRACQHVVSEKGTLYSRVYDRGYDLFDIDDFVLLSYPLPRKKVYLSSDTSYRISVEYMVQKGLLATRGKSKRPYTLISKVVPGEFTGLRSVIEISAEIVDDFFQIYEDA